MCFLKTSQAIVRLFISLCSLSWKEILVGVVRVCPNVWHHLRFFSPGSDESGDDGDATSSFSAEGVKRGMAAFQERMLLLQKQLDEKQHAIIALKKELVSEVHAKKAYERRYADERDAR